MARKISELPHSFQLPEENEFVLPVYLDNTDYCLKKISINKIIEEIKNRVTEGGEISIVEVKNGFKFIKEQSL